MKGISIKDFMNKVYYGDELEFKIGDTTYFIQGFQSDGAYVLLLDCWNTIDGTEPPHDYLLELKCNSLEERFLQFEKARIFNGKNIYEVENEISVLYG